MNQFDYEGNGLMDMMPINMMTLPDVFMNNTNMNMMDTSNNNGIQNTNSFFTPSEAFTMGNLFRNLYKGYKNYRPFAVNPRNEKERMLLNYLQLNFASHELNLYLDNFPNDNMIIRLFNDYRTMANQALKAYEEKYGPITITSEQLNQSPWMWEQLDFPWDKGGM